MLFNNPQPIHISTGTIIRFFIIIFGLAALYAVRDVVAALFFAIIAASAVEPAIEWLKQRRVPRVLGAILIYLAGAAALFFVVYLIFPLLLEEFRGVSRAYPEFLRQAALELEQVGGLPLVPSFVENITERIGEFSAAAPYLGAFGSGLAGFAAKIFGGIFSFILIVIFSFYLAIQEKGIEKILRLISPVVYEPYFINLWERSQRKLGRWMRAQLLLGAIVGVLIFFGLTFLGVERALFFALLAGFFEIIPIAGPILAAVPAVGTAFFDSAYLGLAVVALYVAVQQIESHVIVPVVMSKAVGLNPLVVVLALLTGFKIGGIFGILLSVPITVVLAEFLEDWNIKKREG